MTAELLPPGGDIPGQSIHLRAKPYSPESLAERWDCSAEKVRQMVHRGELDGFRLGKLIRIPAIEVEKYECSQQQEVNAFNSSPTGESLRSLSDGEKTVAEFRLGRMIRA
jgi:excisionase family DNA binding protein